MNTQDDLRALRSGAPLAGSEQLAPQRAALVAAIREDDGSRPTPVRPPFPRRRLVAGAATVAAFAVAGGVVVSLPGHSRDRTDGPPRVLSAQASADTLELAAATVEKTGSHEPRAKQWVYEKSRSSVFASRPQTAETWQRWDGSGSATLPAGTDPSKLHVEYMPSPEKKWRKEGFDDRTQRELYDFLLTLPSDPDLMLRAIRDKHALGDDPGETQAQRDWREIDVLYRSVLIPPKVQAGLLRALAKVPGARVEKGIKDPAGRPVIGVTVNYAKPAPTGQLGKQELWFDPTTFAYMGEISHYLAKVPTHGPTAASYTVRFASGVVDKPGLRP